MSLDKSLLDQVDEIKKQIKSLANQKAELVRVMAGKEQELKGLLETMVTGNKLEILKNKEETKYD